MGTTTTQHIAEATIAVSNKVIAGGAGASIVSGLTLNDWGVIIGITIAIVGFVTSTIINVWFKRQQLKIMKED